MNDIFKPCKALTFDLFGTVLDLRGTIVGAIDEFLEGRSSEVDSEAFWMALRSRQRIEQFQDTLLAIGHTGYLETVERAFRYTSRLHGLEPTTDEAKRFIERWRELQPFPECLAALKRLHQRFRLVALSNGNAWFLEHLVKNQIRFDFDLIFSVDTVGFFKPVSGVYRRAALEAGHEIGELIMVSANSFDVVGARSAGMRAVFVNRNQLPFDDVADALHPDAAVADFTELADLLL